MEGTKFFMVLTIIFIIPLLFMMSPTGFVMNSLLELVSNGKASFFKDRGVFWTLCSIIWSVSFVSVYFFLNKIPFVDLFLANSMLTPFVMLWILLGFSLFLILFDFDQMPSVDTIEDQKVTVENYVNGISTRPFWTMDDVLNLVKSF
jgi:hypothetical protein